MSEKETITTNEICQESLLASANLLQSGSTSANDTCLNFVTHAHTNNKVRSLSQLKFLKYYLSHCLVFSRKMSNRFRIARVRVALIMCNNKRPKSFPK